MTLKSEAEAKILIPRQQCLEAEDKAEARSSRPRPRPSPKFWSRDQSGFNITAKIIVLIFSVLTRVSNSKLQKFKCKLLYSVFHNHWCKVLSCTVMVSHVSNLNYSNLHSNTKVRISSLFGQIRIPTE